MEVAVVHAVVESR